MLLQSVDLLVVVLAVTAAWLSVMFSGGVAAGSEDVMAALTGILSAEGSTVETSMLHQ